MIKKKKKINKNRNFYWLFSLTFLCKIVAEDRIQPHKVQGFQLGDRFSFPPPLKSRSCFQPWNFLMVLAWGGAPLLPSSSSESPKHGSGLEALLAPAINALFFSPQLSTCCTGATSSRQGSCLAASSCCSSPWPSSASSVLWPTWPSPASRPPLASESTNQSYRPCRRLTRAIPSSECFVVMAGDRVSCGGSIPSGSHVSSAAAL